MTPHQTILAAVSNPVPPRTAPLRPSDYPSLWEITLPYRGLGVTRRLIPTCPTQREEYSLRRVGCSTLFTQRYGLRRSLNSTKLPPYDDSPRASSGGR